MSLIAPHYDGPWGPPLGDFSPDDPTWWQPQAWFPRYYKIIPREGGAPVPMRLNSQQCVLAAYTWQAIQENKRIVHVKPRKIGASTFFTGVLTQHCMYRQGAQCMILANNQVVTQQLSRAAVRFYNSVPEYMRPARRERVERSIDIPALDSFMSVATAGSSDPARGFTGLQGLLATEISSWTKPDVWASVLSNLPQRGAFVVAESTPKFFDDPLQQLWKQADTPDSPWLKCFINWLSVPEYSIEPPVGWVPNEVVRDYADTYKLNPRQSFWMSAVGMPNCGNRLDLFRSEFPVSELDCWRQLGSTVFNNDKLQERLRELGQENEQTGDAREFLPPVEGHRYAIAVDPASSFSKRDFFGIQCIDLATCEQVFEASLHGDAFQIARWLVHQGKRYNGATIACEANGVGDALLLCLMNLAYPRVYHRGKGKDQKPGWWSDQRRKVEAFGCAQELLDDGSCSINSHRLIRQMADHTGPSSTRARDSEGGHYDLVMAWVICMWLYKHEFGGTYRSRQTSAKDLAAKAWKKLVERFSGDDAGHSVEDRFGIHRKL